MAKYLLKFLDFSVLLPIIKSSMKHTTRKGEEKQTISVYMPVSMVGKLIKMAERERRAISEMAMLLIEKGLDKA